MYTLWYAHKGEVEGFTLRTPNMIVCESVNILAGLGSSNKLSDEINNLFLKHVEFVYWIPESAKWLKVPYRTC